MKTIFFLLSFVVCFPLADKLPKKKKSKNTTAVTSSSGYGKERLSYWIKQTGNDTLFISPNRFRKNEKEPIENVTREKMNQQVNPENQSPYESIFGDILYQLLPK